MTDLSALIPPRALARPDLAEQAVEGLVRAAAYRPTDAFQLVSPSAELRDGPEATARRVSELVFGEAFDVLESRGPRAWGRARRDGAIGWIDRAALGPVAAPDARIALPRTPARRSASAEAEVVAVLPWNALVQTGGRRDGFVQVVGAGWVAQDAVAPFGDFDPDPATAAERLLGTPHALGGRTDRATDCSGLVQQALTACGLAGGRYAPDQAQLGRAVRDAEARRGDLVIWLKPDLDVWGGHSAIVHDAGHLVHATGAARSVVMESFAAAADRYAAEGFDAPVFRRV
ncbi:MAG: C40 family peptidase [Brevundimonas sp.]|uniref:C40 family peptidase n=1 Tax=Brevundimonas sp. TaxID=1871086 RepID=UPI0025BA9620|nr:NlpC/P60 family protein [Brevundimonas sp.]MBX3476868.1 C40 family peptidase [Brevundimonas sp.]